MEDIIEFFNGHILIDGTLIKINQIFVIKPNPNRYIGGIMLLLSSGNEITFEKVPMREFNALAERSDLADFFHIQNFFINSKSIIAIAPIPEHYGFDGTHVYFEGAGKVDIPNIEYKLMLKKYRNNLN